MGIAKDFNKVIHKEIDVHAAWLPVTNTFKLGDFGMISDGVFVRMGSVESDFGVGFETQAGDGTRLDFKSDQVRSVRIVAGAEVAVWPGDYVGATLKIEFRREKSFYLKAALSVTEMASPFAVAQALSGKPGWDAGKFKVLSAVYTGKGCVILSSRASNASFEVAGKAGALKQLDVGSAEGALTVASKSGMGLEILGATGVVGLRMFRVERSGQPRYEAVEAPGLSQSTDWGADLEDDL
jgi:hypothetical protein